MTCTPALTCLPMNACVVLPLRPSAVIFDLDGLLLDSEQVQLDCMNQAAAEIGLDLSQALLHSLIGRSEVLNYQSLSEQLGQKAAAALLNRATACYNQHVNAGLSHRPGVRELLDLLVDYKLPRAVATSSQRHAALSKLENAGLLGYFAAVATSSDVSLPKPAPDVYLLAAQKLGIQPAHCLALEDSPTGVQAALAAGMTVIQVPDLLLPDDSVRALGHRIADSLHQVRQWLHAVLV